MSSSLDHRELFADEAVRDASPQTRGGAILIVDDEPGIRNFLHRYLSKTNALVELADSLEEADRLRERCHFDLMILDIRLPGGSGLSWLAHLREQGERADVIFMTAHADLETAIEALRAGAADFILKPFRIEQMRAAVDRCLARQRLSRENFVLRRQVSQFYALEGVVGQCEAFKHLCALIKRVAPMPSTVLVSGESGTGKELAARSIHTLSGREGPFVPLNCGAISAELLESELFGHVKGAFTGAHQARDGLCHFAHAGTLFLDEIGEMPLGMQTKLLRFLEERTVRPVGANREAAVDVRVIAATNRDLAAEVAAGRFREDLYYRLNVVNLQIPPLRERADDIPVLARHFNHLLATELGMPPLTLDVENLSRMQAYDWPGNVRELRNVLERALLLGQPPEEALKASPRPLQASETARMNAREPAAVDSEGVLLAELERRHILQVLDQVAGNKSEAARRLGVSRKTLERKLKSWSVAGADATEDD